MQIFGGYVNLSLSQLVLLGLTLAGLLLFVQSLNKYLSTRKRADFSSVVSKAQVSFDNCAQKTCSKNKKRQRIEDEKKRREKEKRSYSFMMKLFSNPILSISHSHSLILILSFSHSLILSFSHSLILILSHSLILSFSQFLFFLKNSDSKYELAQ
eukprot:Lithocolla_globosa_v1_NODE_3235_length_1726_cov_5.158588.p2 type:complete len:155 gc:universal NODE_3235_length_1726_cov_5.158588:1505-1041(-)